MNKVIFESFLQQGWAHGTLAVLGGIVAAHVGRWLGAVEPLPVAHGGLRGEHRRAALIHPVFRALDPALRFGGGVLSVLLGTQRSATVRRGVLWRWVSAQEALLIASGEPLGLCPLELQALRALLALLGAILGVFVAGGEDTWSWLLGCSLLGISLPTFRLRALATTRRLEMSLELPAAIDLMALAMGAGCDFPAALKKVVAGQRGVVAEELRQVLLALELGTTRKSALLALESRIPVEEVRDLVRAVILAEEKGSTVAEALAQQAQTSRQRRSVRAEESAARAGTLLVLPLMLLMACVLVMLFGPLLLKSAVF